jgi:phenylalanyl-tRNA synthetase beta chain
MRGSLLPGLLRRVEHNFAHGNRDVRLFEIGTAFRRAGPGEPPHESTRLAAVLTGLRAPAHWAAEDEPYTVWDLKSLLEDVARGAHGDASLAPGCEDARLDGSAAFTVSNGGGVVGRGGRVVAGAMDAPVWAGAVWGLEVELPRAVPVRGGVTYRRLPTFPPVDRDVALLVPDHVPSASVSAAMSAQAGALLEDVSLFDVYAGEGIPAGMRSLAFRLRFRAAERTLKDSEVDKAVQSMLGRLEEELGVQTRG